MELTRQEKAVLLVLILVLLFGALLNLAVKRAYPVTGLMRLIDDAHLYPKVDLNTATERELEKVPSIGPATARRIVAYRELHGRFQAVSDLKKVRGIGERSLKVIIPHVRAGQGPYSAGASKGQGGRP